MVTRTFVNKKIELEVISKSTKDIYNMTVTIPANKMSESKRNRLITEQLNDDDLVILHELNETDIEEVRGMTEEDFMKYSEPYTRPASQQK